jgi:hypothetical protein
VSLVLTTKIVGLTFQKEYPSNVFALSASLATEDDSLEMVREPNNQYDPNAIVVNKNGKMIGHLPKNIAQFVAPQMDSGIEWYAVIESIVISQDNPDNPGVKMTLWSEENE